ncbi:MAG: Bax inhibitor-1 family protein [Pseudobdellovibrionaceae bacterium]
MENWNSNVETKSRSTVYDAGLRQHMSSIYNRMTAGVLVTGIVAYIAASIPGFVQFLAANPILFFILALSPVAVIWFGFRPDRMPASKLRVSFFILSALYGLSFSSIFMVYTGTDIARAFFLAAGAFAGLSLFGYVTKKNLDGMGSFLIMGVWGLLLLSVVAMIWPSSALMNMISAAGILVFGGLTAWETQRMKEMYSESYGTEANSRIAWMGALNLYISFVALFQYILHFIGNNR